MLAALPLLRLIRLFSAALPCVLIGFLTTSYSQGRGDELIQKYLDQSARRSAIVSMVADYQEPQKQPVRLEFTWMRRVKQGLASHLLRMEAPPSEKGKLLLVQEKPAGETDYIAFRPNSTLKKKVRVSGSRNYKYKGFTISVQELIGGELHKYSHQYKGSQVIDGVTCHVVENRLRAQFRRDSNYPLTVIYLRADNGMALMWELFGTPNRLDKVIKVDELRKIDGIWTVARASVQDLKKKGQLRLSLQQAAYNPSLKEHWFSEEYLKQNSR